MAKSKHQKIYFGVGVILVVLGILSFFFDPLFGVIEVGWERGVFYILTGITAMVVGSLVHTSIRYLAVVLTYLYIFLALTGIFLPGETVLVYFKNTPPNNFLHTAIAILFFCCPDFEGTKLKKIVNK